MFPGSTNVNSSASGMPGSYQGMAGSRLGSTGTGNMLPSFVWDPKTTPFTLRASARSGEHQVFRHVKSDGKVVQELGMPQTVAEAAQRVSVFTSDFLGTQALITAVPVGVATAAKELRAHCNVIRPQLRVAPGLAYSADQRTLADSSRTLNTFNVLTSILRKYDQLTAYVCESMVLLSAVVNLQPGTAFLSKHSIPTLLAMVPGVHALNVTAAVTGSVCTEEDGDSNTESLLLFLQNVTVHGEITAAEFATDAGSSVGFGDLFQERAPLEDDELAQVRQVAIVLLTEYLNKQRPVLSGASGLFGLSAWSDKAVQNLQYEFVVYWKRPASPCKADTFAAHTIATAEPASGNDAGTGGIATAVFAGATAAVPAAVPVPAAVFAAPAAVVAAPAPVEAPPAVPAVAEVAAAAVLTAPIVPNFYSVGDNDVAAAVAATGTDGAALPVSSGGVSAARIKADEMDDGSESDSSGSGHLQRKEGPTGDAGGFGTDTHVGVGLPSALASPVPDSVAVPPSNAPTTVHVVRVAAGRGGRGRAPHGSV